MKRNNNISTYIAWILFISMLTMAGSLKGQDKTKGILRIDNPRFEESEGGDSLIVSLDFKIQGEAISKCTGMRIIPIIESPDSSLTLPYIRLSGKSRERQDTRRFVMASDKDLLRYRLPSSTVSINKDNETTFQYYLQVPYQVWMDTASFVLQEEFSDCGSGTRVHRLTVNQRLKLRARDPYVPQTQVAFLTPEKEIKIRKRQGRAYLDFPVGRSVIQPNFRRNPEELAKINDAVSDLVNNKDAQIKGLFIEGYASPEGSFKLNERLSRERANALKTYLMQKYSFPESMFTVSSVAEDWDGLVAMIQATDMQYKDEILKIIAETDIPDEREKKLMALAKGVPYRKMLKEMFPELRRVEYRIDYQVRDYTAEESKVILSQKPEFLSQQELYTLALFFGKDSKEYTSILIEVIPRYYPDDMVALNNAAARMLENGELSTAKRYLDRALDNAGEKNAAILNNMGVFNLLAGDLDKAEELFNKAASMGSAEAVHNKIEVDAKRKDNKLMERLKNR